MVGNKIIKRMENERMIHRRLIRNTTLFFDEILALGFKEIKSEGHGNNVLRKFKKGNKYIYSHNTGMTLFEWLDPDTPVPDKLKTLTPKSAKVQHQGLSIHDEMLKFFAQRNPIT